MLSTRSLLKNKKQVKVTYIWYIEHPYSLLLSTVTIKTIKKYSLGDEIKSYILAYGLCHNDN